MIGGALGLMTALRYPELVSSLVLVSSAALGKKVSIYLRLVTLPILGDLLESSRVGGTRFMLYKEFHDRRFATEELVEELFRSRRMPGAKEAVVRVLRNTVNILGVRKEVRPGRQSGELEASSDGGVGASRPDYTCVPRLSGLRSSRPRPAPGV